MTKIFCIEGMITDDDLPALIIRRWPVCWRLDPSDAASVKLACDQQRNALYSRLSPLREAWRELHQTRQHEQRNLPGRRHGPRARKLLDDIDERFRSGQAKIEQTYAQITTDWLKDALDPLFPLPSFPSTDQVTYEIIEFLDDPREVGLVEIMRMRAQLHSYQPTSVDLDDFDGLDID